MKKNKVLLLLLASMFVLSMAITTSAQEEVTLTAWTHDELYLNYFESRIPEWEEMHPDINFIYDFQVLSNAPDAALTALAAGEPLPDLLGIEQVPELHAGSSPITSSTDRRPTITLKGVGRSTLMRVTSTRLKVR